MLRVSPSDIAQSISDKPIICSGISMGTKQAVEDYVAQMTKNVLAPSFKQCERNGADQGVHNVLVHRYEDHIKHLSVLPALPSLPGSRCVSQRRLATRACAGPAPRPSGEHAGSRGKTTQARVQGRSGDSHRGSL
jgi:hypothetical protein